MITLNRIFNCIEVESIKEKLKVADFFFYSIFCPHLLLIAHSLPCHLRHQLGVMQIWVPHCQIPFSDFLPFTFFTQKGAFQRPVFKDLKIKC